MVEKARKSVTDLRESREVALDIGQGMEGMKEGIAQVMPVYGTDMKRQYKGREEGMATPGMIHVVREGEDDLILDKQDGRWGRMKEGMARVMAS